MSDQPFFLTRNTGLLQATPEDDLLHPRQNARVSGDTLTETQYFGFSVPEHGIHGLAYLWHHANLKVVTGGLMAWRGIKRISIAAELFDFRAFLSDRAIDKDLHAFRLENGYGVRILEPNKLFHITYEDSHRHNAVDLISEAVTPIAMFGDGNHFEQGMKVRGTITLRGETFDVDCYNVRDRSWGKLRPEASMALPPYSWITGCFGENMIFNCSVMDHAGGSSASVPRLEIRPEDTFKGGWLWKDGRLQLITGARKDVERDPATFDPRAIRLTFVTEDGAETTVRGELVATCPWSTWPNIVASISLFRWDLEGRTGYGDVQDVIWGDYAYEMSKQSG